MPLFTSGGLDLVILVFGLKNLVVFTSLVLVVAMNGLLYRRPIAYALALDRTGAVEKSMKIFPSSRLITMLNLVAVLYRIGVKKFRALEPHSFGIESRDDAQPCRNIYPSPHTFTRCASGCVVKCRICNREVACSNLGRATSHHQHSLRGR